MHLLPPVLIAVLNLFAAAFALLLVVLVGSIIVMYIIDRRQHVDAIRHNFPVVGRFRSLFEYLGEFFRQYFFAMDRQEMPFNRAERNWANHAAERKDNTLAFGSTKNLFTPGTAIFVNCPFAKMDEEIEKAAPLTIGPHVEHSFTPTSFFNISGMSYGAISKPAVLALSKGAKMAGCWMNTGEGGLSPYHLEGGADIIFQIGTAKYGVRNADGTLDPEKLKKIAAYPQVKMIEVKLSQGAKPGKGGMLPGEKVTEDIARIRGIEVGQSSRSPNRHPEISSVAELLDFIEMVRQLTQKPVGFKTVIGSAGWIDDLCLEINRRGEKFAPDFITLDSADGGTGAAPMPLMDNVGLTIRESIPLVDTILKRHGLRDRTRLIASGKLVTPTNVALSLCAGADYAVSARGFMFALGCIQALKCNKNTCPTGITTHDKALQAGLDPEEKSVRVMNYCEQIRHEVEMIARSCGVDSPRLLSHEHVRVMQEGGYSVPFTQLLPEYLQNIE
ncbi:FMN-binding glutamate synthase family protein [Flexibacterium corallicola]|uniref:FMN-binding glutamate synthase family protein n=1 Tax=Flexibacterium corallicola TaxID=3037259 RepID=UPI00286ED6F3|nr:FMN-binding glutamate synthase family protein [Pseudovibrio sp. M1P-2-3]